MKRDRDLEVQLGIRHVRLHIGLVWLFSSVMGTIGLLGVSADEYVPVILGVITVIAIICVIIISTPIFRKQMIKIGKGLIED